VIKIRRCTIRDATTETEACFMVEGWNREADDEEETVIGDG
jgi:hypothetical protein